MTPENKEKIVDILVVVCAILTAALLIGAYKIFKTPEIVPTQQVAVETKPAETVEKVVKKTITPKKVVVYDKKAKVKLKLPENMLDDESIHVTASTTIKASDNPQTISTVFNEVTGESKTYVKLEPKPWIDVDTRTTIGAYVGYKNGEQIGRLQVTQSLLNVKSINVGLIATFDQPLTGVLRSDYFVGAGVSYRF